MELKTNKKILVITTLYPNNQEPAKAPFNFEITQELSEHAQVKVIAGVRGFFSRDIPFCEEIGGIKVYHPKIFLPPKVLRCLHGFLYFLSIKDLVKRLHNNFSFDLILAPYLYPDGFAGVLISKMLKKPVVLEALGCDVNLLLRCVMRRVLIRYACKNADAIITVTADLKNKLMGIGIPEKKISVIYNGVNLEGFKPTDKNTARHLLGLSQDKKIVLFAGNLEEVKGLRFLIESWRRLVKRFDRKIMLIVIGEGKEKNRLLRLVNKYRIKDYVLMTGDKSHSAMPQWMNATDVFCLPSIREGCPNVLLEALSCHKLVVASNVGGIPEIIRPTRSSILVEPANIESLTKGLEKALSNGPSETQDTSVIPLKSWSDSVLERLRLFQEIWDYKKGITQNICTKAAWKFYLFNLKAGVRAFLKNIDYFRFREYLMALNEIGVNFNHRKEYKLLDIGCGEEVFGIFLAKTLNWDVSVVDVNRQKILFQNKYLKKLKDKYTSFKAEVVDARRMPYSNNSFDVVTCFAVTPLIEGDGDISVLQEITRVLKDNGIAYVTVGYGLQYKEQWNTVSTRGFSRVYDETALQERLIKASGLVLDKRLYFGHPSINFSRIWYRLPFLLKLPFRWMTPLFTLSFLKSIDPSITEKIDFSKVNGTLLVLKKHKGTP